MPGLSSDVSELRAYLSEKLDVSSVHLKKIHSGVNLTLLVTTSQGSREYILRKPSGIRNLEVFVDIRQEYTLMDNLQATSVPVPKPVLLCEKKSISGPFMVMPYVGESEGRSTTALLKRADQRARNQAATCLADTLAKIHSVKSSRIPNACDSKPLAEHLDGIIGRIRLSKENIENDSPQFYETVERLDQNIPDSRDMALVHRDFRPSNVVLAGVDEPTIAGVLDWETALVTDPLVDVGYLALHWNGIPEVSELSDASADRNESNAFSFQPRQKYPSTRKLLSQYERRTGYSVENIRFYESLAALDLAAIWTDMLRYQSENEEKSELRQRINRLLKTANILTAEM